MIRHDPSWLPPCGPCPISAFSIHSISRTIDRHCASASQFSPPLSRNLRNERVMPPPSLHLLLLQSSSSSSFSSRYLSSYLQGPETHDFLCGGGSGGEAAHHEAAKKGGASEGDEDDQGERGERSECVRVRCKVIIYSTSLRFTRRPTDRPTRTGEPPETRASLAVCLLEPVILFPMG